MRFSSIQLHNIGELENSAFYFHRRGTSDLHLISGPNEAGKTTLHKALIASLFDDYASSLLVPENRSGEIEATVEFDNGSTERIHRELRRGRRKSLDFKGSVVSEARKELLVGLTQDFYRLVFGLNHAALQEGSRELLSARGSLRELLFGRASGLESVRALDEDLEEHLGNLFKSRGANPTINRTISEFEELKTKLAEATHSVDEWQALTARIQRTQLELHKLEEEYQNLSHEILEAERILRVYTPVTELLQIRNALSRSCQVDIPEKDRERFTVLLQKRDELLRSIQREEADYEAVQQALRECSVEDSTLLNGEQINFLKEGLGQHEEREQRIKTLRTSYETLLDQTRIALARLGLSAIELDRSRLSEQSGDLQTLKILLIESSDIHVERCDVLSAVASLESEIVSIKKATEEERLPSQDRVAELQKQVTQLEVLKNRVHDLREQVEQGSQALEQRGKSLRWWSNLRSMITSLNLPPVEELRAWRFRYEKVSEEQKMLSRDLQHLISKQEAILRQTDTQGSNAPTFTRIDLVAARRKRDEALISLEDPEFLGNLELRQERLSSLKIFVLRADEIADTIAKEHSDVLKYEYNQKELSLLKQQIEAVQDKLSLVKGEQRVVLDEFSRFWKELPVQSEEPEWMLKWLEELRSVQKEALRLEDAQCKAAAVEAQYLGLKKDVCELSTSLFTTPLGSVEEIRGELRLYEERRAKQLARSEKVLTLESLKLEKEQIAIALHVREQEYAKIWKERLSSFTSLSLDLPAQALHYVEQLSKHFEDLLTLCNQADVMEMEQRLTDEYTGVLEAVLSGHSRQSFSCTREKVNFLTEKFQQNRDAYLRKGELSPREEQIRKSLEEYRTTLNEVETELSELLLKSSVDSIELFSRTVQESQERRALSEKTESLEKQLSLESRDVTELISQVKQVDEDTVRLRREVLLEKRNHAHDSIKELHRELGRLSAEQEAFSKGMDAVEAAFILECKVAELSELVEEYAELFAARYILNCALEEHRQLHQEPVLHRASDYLAVLTSERYRDIRVVESDNKEDTLLVTNRWGKALETSVLSDGTRDQLFLALRLAVMIESFKDRESLPLFFDDILINFDEVRSEAALELFSEIARSHQVLLFTHHHYVVELARPFLKDGRAELHTFDGTRVFPEEVEKVASRG